MNNQLNHFALNSPAQGLNGLGWRFWVKKAVKAIASFVPGGTLIYDFAADIVNDLDNSDFNWQRTSFNNPTDKIPDDWYPTFDEELYLNLFVEKNCKEFVEYINQVFDNIKNNTNYASQLVEYNNLVHTYALFKNYHINNRNKGLGEYAQLAKIEVIDIFMREIYKQLEMIFNQEINLNAVKKPLSFPVGSEIILSFSTLKVEKSFSFEYNEFQLKSNTVTTTDPVTGNTITTTPDDTNSTVKPPLGNGSNPENPTTGKTYLWGWIDFDKKPYQSIGIIALMVLGVRKLIK